METRTSVDPTNPPLDRERPEYLAVFEDFYDDRTARFLDIFDPPVWPVRRSRPTGVTARRPMATGPGPEPELA